MEQFGERQALALDLARQLVHEVAPEELDLFEELAVEPVPTGRRKRDDPLASGLGELVVVITPYAIHAATAVLAFLLPKLGEAAIGIAKDLAKERLRTMLFSPSSATPRPDLLVRVREVTLTEARMAGLDDVQARALAEAMVPALARAVGGPAV
jgi:hypothetical protein